MKVKGISGVFLTSKDVARLNKWYADVLGISLEDWNGTVINQEIENEMNFCLFAEDSDYFPKEQSVMLNFQVDNMEAWLKHFDEKGIPIVKELEKSEFGTFVWISDPEGKWIEIWEK